LAPYYAALVVKFCIIKFCTFINIHNYHTWKRIYIFCFNPIVNHILYITVITNNLIRIYYLQKIILILYIICIYFYLYSVNSFNYKLHYNLLHINLKYNDIIIYLLLIIPWFKLFNMFYIEHLIHLFPCGTLFNV